MDLQVRLLNAVDQAASVLASAVDDEGRFYVQRYSGRLDSHWATIASGGEQRDTFLAFAARCHLFSYVKATLEQSPLNKIDCTRLLCTVLSNYQLPLIFPDRGMCSPTEPDLRLIKLFPSLRLRSELFGWWPFTMATLPGESILSGAIEMKFGKK